jgi:hypothetical protein
MSSNENILRLTLSFFILCSVLRAQSPQQQYKKVKDDLLSLKIDETKEAAVENLQIQREGGVISLRSGTLYVLSPINESIHALLFVGKGLFTFSPPTEIEKKQLYRFYGKEKLAEEFKSVFILFSDSTFREISKTTTFVRTQDPLNVDQLLKKSVNFLQNHSQTGIEYDVFRQFLFNEANDFFYSHIITDRDYSYFFVIDPFNFEGVSLQRQYEEGVHSLRETICQFPVKADSIKDMDVSYRPKSIVRISSYKMDNTIHPNLEFSSKCIMTITNLERQRKWIPFELHSEFIMDSVIACDKKCCGIKDEESDIVWIGDGQSFPFNKEMPITLYYHGKLINNYDGWYSLRSSILWYPWAADDRQYTTFDLTFHTPKNLAFATVGKRLFYDTTDNDITSHWILNKRIRNASFILGNFDEYSIAPDSGMPLTLYLAKAHDVDLKVKLASQLVLSGSHMEEQVSNDIENSLHVFQYLFGKPDIEHLYVAEVPESHGESFPGLMHLAWSTFQNTRDDGSDEIFRAHEVAHQWWASAVDFRTYHDQWLSEAFAEYSGLWYMQLALHNNGKFFDKLEEYKSSILSNRKYLFGNGQEAGPIWLGYRTEGSRTNGDYDLIIYRKGAWVLHMLRMIAINLQTMNEDIFTETLKDFYTTYKGTQASTEDFKNTVEKHFGMDMSWFFNQWVYGTEIPTYHISYKCNELPNEKYRVHCTVKQNNVADNYQMPVPFFIDFGGNKFARIRHLIKGPITEFDFPIMPLKPIKIKFNDLQSVLCEVKDEGWE